MKILVRLEEYEEHSPIKLADAIINYCRDTYDAEYWDLAAGEIAEHIQVYLKYKSISDGRLRGESGC
jgi:hypothetical protein